jgi:hypothetical protein
MPFSATLTSTAVYPDARGAGAIEAQVKGIEVREAIKAKGSVKAGVRRVRQFLERGRLKIQEGLPRASIRRSARRKLMSRAARWRTP